MTGRFLFLFLMIASGISAIHPPDSLLRLALKTTSNEKKIELLCEAAQWWRDRNEYDSALVTLNQALSQAQTMKQPALIANVYFHLGGLNWRRGRYEEARMYYHKSIDIRQSLNDTSGVAASYMNLALVQRDIGSFDAALKTLSLTEKFYRQMEDTSKLSNVFSLKGGVFLRINQYDSAEHFFRKALKIRILQKDSSLIASSYTNLATLFKTSNSFDSSIFYFQKALDIQNKLHESPNLAFTYLNLGGLFWDNKNYRLALDNYLASLEIYEKLGDKLRIGSVLENIGLIYRDIGNIERALSYHHQVLSIYKKLGNSVRESIAYNILAGNHLTARNYDSALHYYYESLKQRKEIGSAQMIATNYNSLGQVYKNLQKFDSAHYYYFQALSIYFEMGDRKNYANTLNNIANLKWVVNQNDSAMIYFKRAIDIRQKINDKLGLAYSSLQFGELLLNLNQLSLSRQMLTQAYQLASQLEIKEIKKESTRFLSQFYEKIGDPSLSLRYYKEFQENEAALNKEETIKAIADMEIRFENERKQRLLERKQLEIELKDSQIREKNLRLYFLLGALVLTLSLVIVVTIAWRQKVQTNRILTAQKQEIEQQRDQIRQQNEKITDSIIYASRIQTAMLPPEEWIRQLFPNHFIFYRPRDVVSGDFYWVHQEAHLKVMAVADCTGHGVPGAFMSMLGISLLNELQGQYSKFDPALVLGALRGKIRKNLHQSNYMETNTDGMDMGLVIINTLSNEAVFSGGNIPLWLWQNGEMNIINPDRMPVGVYIGEDQPFTNHFFQINQGDAFYLFSDGYCDQFGGEKGRKLMQNGFLAILRQCAGRNPDEQKQILQKELVKWQGQHRQIDDILVVGVIS